MKLYKLALIGSLLFPSIAFAQSGGDGLDTKALDGQQRYAEINIPFVFTSSGSSNINFASGMPYSSSNANTLVNGDFQGSGLTTSVAYSTLTIPGTLGAAVTGNGANGSSIVIRLRGNRW